MTLTSDQFAAYLGVDVEEWQKAWADVYEAIAGITIAFDALWKSTGREYPDRSRMHAAYRIKTRHRNRRR